MNPYFELFEAVEGYLFTITSIFLVSFISLEVYNNKIKCDEADDCCTVEECDITKKNKDQYYALLRTLSI